MSVKIQKSPLFKNQYDVFQHFSYKGFITKKEGGLWYWYIHDKHKCLNGIEFDFGEAVKIITKMIERHCNDIESYNINGEIIPSDTYIDESNLKVVV